RRAPGSPLSPYTTLFRSVARSGGRKLFVVIPAKAGIQPLRNAPKNWIPVFAGMTSEDVGCRPGKDDAIRGNGAGLRVARKKKPALRRVSSKAGYADMRLRKDARFRGDDPP